MFVTFGICFKQDFDTRYLVFYNPSHPRMFLSPDLLSEYRIQHGAIGPHYVPSSYSTMIFCRRVSGFATDCPCDVSCRGLTTCLLHVGPPFGNGFLNTSWAVGLTYWIAHLHFLYFDICLDASYHFLALALLLKYSLFFSITPVLTYSMDVVFVLFIVLVTVFAAIYNAPTKQFCIFLSLKSQHVVCCCPGACLRYLQPSWWNSLARLGK